MTASRHRVLGGSAAHTVNIVDLRERREALPILAAWHHAEWESLNPGQTLAERMRRMEGHLGPEPIPSTFVGVGPGDEILGSAALVEHDMETRQDLTPWMASVYVAPQHRRRGVGSALVRHVVDAAGMAGIATLYLFTPDRAAFYAPLGWARVDTTTYRGHDVTIMKIRPGRLSHQGEAGAAGSKRRRSPSPSGCSG